MICSNQSASQIGAQLGPSAQDSWSPGGLQPLSSHTDTRPNRRMVVFYYFIFFGKFGYHGAETCPGEGRQMGHGLSRELSQGYKGQ